MKHTLASFLLSTICLFSARAEDIRYERLQLGGQSTNLLILPSEAPKKVTFYAQTNGNMTSWAEVYLTSPSGLPVEASGAFVKTTVLRALKAKRTHYPVELKTVPQLSREHSMCMDIATEEAELDEILHVEDFPAVDDPICDIFDPQELEEMAQTFSEAYGGTWRKGNICAYLVSVIGDTSAPDEDELCDQFSHFELAQLGIICPDGPFFATLAAQPSTAYRHHYGLFRKDSCIPVRRSRYILMYTVDLSSVNWADYTQGLSLRVSMREKKLSRGREAAIKPESEGRYAPRPIIMMNWLSETCGNKITITKWSRNKPQSITPLQIYGLLSYKIMVINLALVDGALSGGKGTAELFTRTKSYGVCFDLVRKRQNKNDWPA